MSGSMQTLVETKLKESLEPDHLNLQNISPMHNTPPDAESHFQLTMVSKHFEGMTLVKRHRMIHEVLQEELKRIHAFTMNLYTPNEWDTVGPDSISPPECKKT